MLTRSIEGRLGLAPLTEAGVRAWQFERIRAALDRARESSRFYRDWPELKCPADFEALPFTRASDLRRDPHDFLCVRPSDVSRIVTISTSGTTGIKKRVFFTGADMERTADFFHRGMAFLTAPGDRVMIFMPANTEGSVGDLLSGGLRRLGAQPASYGVPSDYRAAATALLEGKINTAVGLPMDLYNIGLTPEGALLRAAGTLRSVLVSADTCTKALSSLITELLGCPVFEHYGMTETGFGGGVFCPSLEGYHLREADMLFEVVDGASGRPCRRGETGEIAVTTFAAEAMPLFRYKTGDIGRFRAAPCPCGYPLPVLERVFCRKSDILTLPDGSAVTRPELEDAVITACLPQSVSLFWDERGKKLRIGVSGARGGPRIDGQMRLRLEKAGAAAEIFETERPETDIRCMTKRGITRI